jgi:hypothetical protein
MSAGDGDECGSWVIETDSNFTDLPILIAQLLTEKWESLGLADA